MPWMSESAPITWVLIVILVVIALLPLFRELRAGTFDLFNSKNFFLFYYLMQLAFFPAYVLRGHEGGTNLFLRADDINGRLFYTATTEAALIGLLAFYAGYYSNLFTSPGSGDVRPREWSSRRVHIAALLFCSIGGAAMIAFIWKHGGVLAFLSDLGYWRSIGMIGEGYLLFPMTVIFPAGALIYYCWVASRRAGHGRIFWATFAFGFSLIPTLMIGFRGILVFSGLQFLSIRHYTYRPLSAKRLALYALPILVLLTAYGVVRQNLVQVLNGYGNEAFDQVTSDDMLQSVVLRSQGSEMVQRVIRQVDESHDYQYWWPGIVETVTMAIPRALWTEKPAPIMLKFGRDFMGDYLIARDGQLTDATGGFSPTAIGYFYWQMGGIGVVIGMFCLGLMARLAYGYLRASPRDMTRIFIYSAFTCAFMLFAESPQDAANSTTMRMITAIAVGAYLIRMENPQEVHPVVT